MQTEQANLYEQAFESFLAENKIPFVWVDQSTRPEFFRVLSRPEVGLQKAPKG